MMMLAFRYTRFVFWRSRPEGPLSPGRRQRHALVKGYGHRANTVPKMHITGKASSLRGSASLFTRFQQLRMKLRAWRNPLVEKAQQQGPKRVGAGGRKGKGPQNVNSDDVMLLICGANIIVWAGWQTDLARSFMPRNFLLSLTNLKAGRIHTLLTCFFSHFNLMHLLTNLVVLYFFAPPAIAALGTSRFLQMYMLAGITSSLGSVLYQRLVPRSNLPASKTIHEDTPSLGASGAVNSVVIYTICVNPYATIYLYFFIPIPAAIFGVIFVLKDVVGAYYGGGNIGHAAHLSGAFVGLVYYFFEKL